jgi:hypothetical protein
MAASGQPNFSGSFSAMNLLGSISAPDPKRQFKESLFE